MSNTFFISDTHFGHYNIVHKFKWPGSDKPLRPFVSVEDMDETIVENWNAIVKPEDKVYHLGDVAINKKALPILDRLNGRKTLIAGNHDIFYTKIYSKYFENVRSYKIYPKHDVIFSHIPVHPSNLENRFKFNVHGHLHGNQVMYATNSRIGGAPIKEDAVYEDENGVVWARDKRYLNVCVEHTNYKPISFDEVLEKLKERETL